jgi:hypothetical protein
MKIGDIVYFTKYKSKPFKIVAVRSHGYVIVIPLDATELFMYNRKVNKNQLRLALPLEKALYEMV